MTALKLFGASLLILAAILFVRSFRNYERERIKTATALLAFLRRATEEAKSFLTPIGELVLSVEDELLLSRGFVTEYKESHSLIAAYKRVAGRYLGRVFSLLEEALTRLGATLSFRDGTDPECEKIALALELEKEASKKNIKVASTLTVAAALGLIILFL